MGQENCIKSDTQLWNDFINGDEDAYRLIYATYVRTLFKYGCHFAKDEALIKDSIQDVFVDLSKYRSRLNSTDNIKLYLFKSLKRKIVRSLGSKKLFGLIDDEKIPFYYTVSVEEEIVDSELKRNRIELLEKALNGLSPRQREAIYLKFVSELSYEELSKVMQMNYQSARNLVFRGLEKLRLGFPRELFLFFLSLRRPLPDSTK
ncbi:MAG: sigma-70 family RNA polymerase sigma factor [Prolixibacteraceae bacterium]